MRVIAGTYRSRQLTAPRSAHTRPTSDRLRETLFNILTPRIFDARFADLYAGTGAVGIEALSRGADHVWFAEKAPPALASIRSNLKALNIQSGYTIEPRGTAALLNSLADQLEKSAAPLDLIFLDPPWDADADYTTTLQFLGSPRAASMLAPESLIIAEHSSRIPLPTRFGKLAQTRTLTQGDAALTFYAQATE
jgi:16S rRNA (guanine(966)-N(2))-methyltransferase RsmD